MLSAASVFITGCSRGLGLEMVKQLVKRPEPPRLIFASCRSPETAGSLQELSYQHDNIKIIKFDVDETESYGEAREIVLAENGGLNILINNAGIAPKSTRINLVTAEHMTRTLHTNLVAPVMLAQAMLPLLAQSGKERPSLIVNMSSILGSIAENTKQGGLYPYRSSKAGLNAVTRSLSVDLKHQNISAVSIHPGWVKTDMGGSNAPLSPAQSVRGVLEFIDTFDPAEHNGNFYNNLGDPVPW